MEQLFSQFSRGIEAGGMLAVGVSFVWGILSILLSPCHLAGIPLIVGFVNDQGRITAKRALIISTLFSLGLLVTIALIGIITALAGRIMGDLGRYTNYFLAGIFFLVGLYMLGVLPTPWLAPTKAGAVGKGIIAAFVLGLVFGVALGPCTFAFMAPVLAVTFKVASDSTVYAVVLLFAYAVWHCSVIILAGTCTELVQKYMNWTSESKITANIKRVCGILIIIAGLYMVYIAP